MKFFVIADELTVLGFRMVGVSGQIVSTREEAEQAVKEAIENRDLGIILITEKTASMIRDLVENLFYTTAFPLILEIPDRDGPVPGRGSIRDIAKNAVGLSI